MHKKIQHLHGGLRGFAAAAAIASLAVFGCSTNRTPGDGQPAMTAPATPSATPGTSSGTSNPPMASAAMEGVSVDRANESAAILAAHQRERFLGTIDPAGPQSNVAQQSQPTGQLIPPSMYANPQATVNASISSAPTPVVTAGDPNDAAAFLDAVGGSAATGATAGTTGAATVGATTGSTVGTVGTTAAPTFSATSSVTATPTTAAIATTPTLTNTLATPTTAAITATPGQFAAGPVTTTTSPATGTASTAILTPTLTSSITPSPTRAVNLPLTSLATRAATTTTTAATSPSTSTSTSTTTSSNAAASSTRTVASARVVAPIRVVTNANGTVTVTNMTSTPPTIIKNQR